MNKYALIIACAVFCGCHKKDELGEPIPIKPTPVATCSYIPANYSGVTLPGVQVVPILGNPLSHTNDIVSAVLCKVADCVNGPIPQTQCAQVGQGVPCSTVATYPASNANISIGTHAVTFTNAKNDGYDTYYIYEWACR